MLVALCKHVRDRSASRGNVARGWEIARAWIEARAEAPHMPMTGWYIDRDSMSRGRKERE